MAKIVNVSAAILIDGNHFFVAQRPEQDMRRNKWEFPGGKIDAGETGEQAIIRELLEELAITVQNPRYFTTVEYDYEVFYLKMRVYIINVKNPTIVYKDGQNGGWFTLTQLKELDFLSADKLVLKQILQADQSVFNG